MTFAGINYLAVIVAAVAAFGFGAVWYMGLGKRWIAALGKTEAELLGPTGKPSPVPYAITAVCQLLLCWGMAGVIGHLGQYSLKGGLTIGFFVWLTFIATTQMVNHRFSNATWTLTFIDLGHWLGVCLIAGAILGLWGA